MLKTFGSDYIIDKKKKCWQKRSKTAKRRKNDRILQETTERAHKIIYPHSVIANFRTEVKRIRIGCESYLTLYLSDSHPLRLEVSVNLAWHRAASTPRKVVDQQAERVSAAYRAEPRRWPRAASWCCEFERDSVCFYTSCVNSYTSRFLLVHASINLIPSLLLLSLL